MSVKKTPTGKTTKRRAGRGTAKRGRAGSRRAAARSKPTPRARGVIFDFDGVLFDTESLHLVAMQAAAAGWGFTLGRDDYLARYAGFDDFALVRTLLRDRRGGVDPADEEVERLVMEKMRRFHAIIPEARPFPGSVRLVASLAGRAVPLAVCSGSWLEEITRLLAAAGLAGAFGAIVAAGDVARGKPHPEGYALATRRLGIPPSEIIAIEDTPDGIAAARAAGLRVTAVAHTYPAEQLSAAGAELVVPRIAELTVDRLLGVDRDSLE